MNVSQAMTVATAAFMSVRQRAVRTFGAIASTAW